MRRSDCCCGSPKNVAWRSASTPCFGGAKINVTGSIRRELTGERTYADTMNTAKPTVDAELEALQHDTFSYFLHETNPHNGLVCDKTAPNWPASIAATGLALAGY